MATTSSIAPEKPGMQQGARSSSPKSSKKDVLTLVELADYLRVDATQLEEDVRKGALPGRRVGKEWRFLKSAVDTWLSQRDSSLSMLSQVGAFANDETLDELRAGIYAARGRPETEKQGR